MSARREVPASHRCVFCADRWLIAIGGQRLCHRHAQLCEEIAKDAGVPVHLTVQQLTRDARPPNPEPIGQIMPRVMAEILANAKPLDRAVEHAVPTPSARER